MPYRNWANGDVPSGTDFNTMFGDASVVDVATTQTTTSTSFGNLSTTGPTVSSVTLNAGQQCWVMLSAVASISGGAGHSAQMSFAVSGAGTQAASSANCAETQNTVDHTVSRVCVFTAPTSGSYTFTAQYCAVNGTTASFGNRRIIVKRW